ncbi:MAG: S8 family serine peptidase [Anaerolineae bacterium]|nr:S8 family serine peptidase [Anaerolineae bacterium]
MMKIRTLKVILTACLAGVMLLVAATTVAESISWQVKLKSRTFTPAAINSAETLLPTDPYVFLQLESGIPDEAERALLQELGVELVQYIPDNTWVAYLPDLIDWETIPGIHAVAPILPMDKMAVPAADFPVDDDGLIAARVLWWDDAAISWPSGIVSAELQDDFSYIVTTADPATLDELAALPTVHRIEPAMERSVLNDTIRTALGLDAPLPPVDNLDGSGVIIGVFDEGRVDDHMDLAGRVEHHPSMFLYGHDVSTHTTHVAGTIAGNGENSLNQGGTMLEWRGVAPAANLIAHAQWINIYNPDSADYNPDIDIANNSWGYPACSRLGDYSIDSQKYDGYTEIPILFAAGNSRQACPAEAPDGYGTILGLMQSAKNILAVGATDPSGIAADFSSMGPTQDGRIKPEVVAPGYSIISTCMDDTYCGFNGTSMSTPAAAGALALLKQYTQEFRPNLPPLSAAAQRALIIHGAADVPPAGPDYATGFGVVNVPAAVAAVDYLTEAVIDDGDVTDYFFYTLDVDAELKITLLWADTPADPMAEQALVNDLDLELIAPDGTVYLPYVLDPETPDATATQGVDHTNIVEQVYVASPQIGLWTARISAGSVPSGSQSYAVVGFAIAPPTAVTTARQAAGTESNLQLFIQLATVLAAVTVLLGRDWPVKEVFFTASDGSE